MAGDGLFRAMSHVEKGAFRFVCVADKQFGDVPSENNLFDLGLTLGILTEQIGTSDRKGIPRHRYELIELNSFVVSVGDCSRISIETHSCKCKVIGCRGAGHRLRNEN